MQTGMESRLQSEKPSRGGLAEAESTRKTTPKEPLPTTRVVEKEKVGPAGAAARAEAVAPEEVVAAAAPLLVAPAAVAPPPPSPPREATGAVRITWEPEAGSPSTTRPS